MKTKKPTKKESKNMKRKSIINSGLSLLTASTALGLTSCATAQPAASSGGGDKKPNVVMLMTDDTGWGDFGCYGGGAEPRPSDPEH